MRLQGRHADEQSLLRADRARALDGAQVEVAVEDGRGVGAAGGELLVGGDGGLQPLDAAEAQDKVLVERTDLVGWWAGRGWVGGCTSANGKS